MNFNVGQRIIVFVGIMTLFSVIVSHPKERTVTISVLSENVDPNYELYVYSPNPQYSHHKKRLKLRKNTSKEKPLFYKIYTVEEQHSDRFSSTVNLYKGRVHKSQDVEGYIYRIEIKDVDGVVHQVDKKALQSMNDKIFTTKPGENIDFVFRKTDQGDYELDYAKLFESVTTKKQVGFFVDEDAAALNPLVVIYGYDSELNPVVKHELQFMRFAYADLKPYEVVDLYGITESSKYIARIEVVVFKGEYITNQVNQDTVDAMNNKIKQASEDEVVYFQLLSKSHDRGYSFIYRPDYTPPS